MEGTRSNGHPIDLSIHHQVAASPPSSPHPLPASGGKRPRAQPKRKKVKIEWIQDDVHRRSTFEKRKRAVMKKAEELHLLCGVETCVVIYGDAESRPEVWPSWEKAAEVCRRFRAMPGHEVTPRMMNHVSFTEDRIQKLRGQIARLEREICDLGTRGLLYDGLLGKELQLAGAVKVALLKMIQELSTEIHLELAARRRWEGLAPAPLARPSLLPQTRLGPVQPPMLSPVEPALQAPVLPPHDSLLQVPLLSPEWPNVYSPWELTVGAAYE